MNGRKLKAMLYWNGARPDRECHEYSTYVLSATSVAWRKQAVRPPTNVSVQPSSLDRCLTTQSAVGFLSHFVAMYHEGDTTRGAADSRSRPAKGMEAVEAAGYLKARFMRARLNGKLQLASR